MHKIKRLYEIKDNNSRWQLLYSPEHSCNQIWMKRWDGTSEVTQQMSEPLVYSGSVAIEVLEKPGWNLSESNTMMAQLLCLIARQYVCVNFEADNRKGCFSNWTKYMDIQYFLVTNQVWTRDVFFKYCATNKILDDFCTDSWQWWFQYSSWSTWRNGITSEFVRYSKQDRVFRRYFSW